MKTCAASVRTAARTFADVSVRHMWSSRVTWGQNLDVHTAFISTVRARNANDQPKSARSIGGPF